MKPTVLIYAAFHGRPEISAIYAEGIRCLQKSFEDYAEIVPYGVCSTDEDALQLESFGFNYTIEENRPLGRKLSKGLNQALKDIQFDAAVLLGSDDIMTDYCFDVILHAIQKGHRYGGISQISILNPKTKQAGDWHQLSNMKMPFCGPGKFFSRDLLEQWAGRIWPYNIDRVLDISSHNKVKSYLGYDGKRLQLTESGIFDIKSGTNIWKYEELKNLKPADYWERLAMLPPSVQIMIEAL